MNHSEKLITVCGQDLRVLTQALENASPGHPPLLIFNGIGANYEVMLPLIEALDGHPVIIFDIPGIGGSPASKFPRRLSGLAKLAAGVLDHFEVPVADVLGYSWGGGLAQQFAHKHPERCRKLILGATSSGSVMVPGKPSVLVKMIKPARYGSTETLYKQAADLYGGRLKDNPELLARHSQLMKKPSTKGYLSQLYAMTGWTSIHWLHRLKQPTLVLAGREDPIVPVINARLLASRIPNAELHLFDCGHLFVSTMTEEVAEVVKEFLNRQQKRATA